MEYQFQGKLTTNIFTLLLFSYLLFIPHFIDVLILLLLDTIFQFFFIFFFFPGAHADIKKTKELQEQGKKINLSLSEMSQFFMKMAEAVIKKKLIPGMSIPGCCSFFLCKYLKDTMLQVRSLENISMENISIEDLYFL